MLPPPDWMVRNYGELSCAVVCRAGADVEGRHRDYWSSSFLVVLLIRCERLVLLSVYSSDAGD